MLLGIPWPTFVENAIAFPLMQLVTQWSVGIVHLLGYPATAAGTTITLPNCTVGVEEACSGLRSLQTALMVGVAGGELARLAGWGRALLLVFGFFMALAGNQVRVLMLVMAGIRGGNAAVESIHDLAGNMVLVILLAGVGAAAWSLSRLQRAPRAAGVAASQDFAVGHESGRPHFAGWFALAAASGALLFAHGWFLVRGSLAAPPSPPMLAPSAESGFAVDEDVPAAILGILQPDRYSYIRQPSGDGGKRAIGYHFYWKPRKGNANQLYHRPDRCMPGAGWRLDGEVTRETFRLGGREFTFNVFPFRSPGGEALMLWGSFLNGEPVEIDFNTDVYLPTANLAQFIRTGTRLYSFEVAACIMPMQPGARPSRAEIEAYANKVFQPADG
jgi:exosortase/archaeosortase family protein